jgi:hypothetical protein
MLTDYVFTCYTDKITDSILSLEVQANAVLNNERHFLDNFSLLFNQLIFYGTHLNRHEPVNILASGLQHVMQFVRFPLFVIDSSG